MNLSSSQKKEWAKLLYTKEHLPQKLIAERVGVTPKTVCSWVKKERWDDLRVSITITKDEQLKALYTQLKELNDEISNRPERRYATTAESDTISKLSNAIEKMEKDTGLADIISVGTSFLSWLRAHDLEKAQTVGALFDDYVKSKLR